MMLEFRAELVIRIDPTKSRGTSRLPKNVDVDYVRQGLLGMIVEVDHPAISIEIAGITKSATEEGHSA